MLEKTGATYSNDEHGPRVPPASGSGIAPVRGSECQRPRHCHAATATATAGVTATVSGCGCHVATATATATVSGCHVATATAVDGSAKHNRQVVNHHCHCHCRLWQWLWQWQYMRSQKIRFRKRTVRPGCRARYKLCRDYPGAGCQAEGAAQGGSGTGSGTGTGSVIGSGSGSGGPKVRRAGVLRIRSMQG
jgi:hypothetical protein